MTRHQLAVEYGLVFARSERTKGGGKIASIPDEVLRHFSRRGESIQEVLRDLGMDEQRLSVHAERIAEALEGEWVLMGNSGTEPDVFGQALNRMCSGRPLTSSSPSTASQCTG